MNNKYQGFTLIECLIALSFMSLFFAALAGILPQSQKVNQQLLDRQELEWQVFLGQMDAIFL
ncbi:MAG: prepilin-type N-terminal cleavage/methylation domain-containing protein, partial [Enterococcus lemanii]